MANQEIRNVAEMLVGSLSVEHSYGSSSNRNIVNSVNLIAEELAQGHRVGGKMSSVRRFFCLLVTFDLLFTSLLWLICILLPGGNLRDIFMSEVLKYNVKSSLVDIVGVAAGRFLILLLFYAILHINNWSAVACTTAFTCGFLIAKVFCYDWVDAKQPVYHVFLILTSFTLAWGEAWFLDSRVFPQEQKSALIIGAISGNPAALSERAPLLAAGARNGAESTYDFYSPLGSRGGSPRTHGSPGPPELLLTCERIDEYRRASEEAVSSSWRLLNRQGWGLEKRGAARGDRIETMRTREHGKVYKFTGTLDCPAKWLFEDLRDNYVTITDWNPTIKKARMIKKITDGLDIVYQIAEGGGGGLVKERDFVLLRRLCALDSGGRLRDCEEAPEAYVLSGTSVDLPECPPVKSFCRGEIKISSWFLSSSVQKTSSGKVEEKCIYRWLFSCDLKGRVPQLVINTFFPSVMLSNVEYIRNHVEDARRKGLF